MIEELLDDQLDETARTHLDDHLSRCPSCQAYRSAALYTRNALLSQPLVMPSERTLNRMWEGLEQRLESSSSHPSQRRSPQRWVPMAVAASIALVIGAGALAYVLTLAVQDDRETTIAQQTPPDEASPSTTPAPPTAPSEPEPLTLTAGALRLSDQQRRPGAELDQGQLTTSEEATATLTMGQRVQVVLGPETAVALTRHQAEVLEFDMSRGWLVGRLDADERPLMLKIGTPAGTVQVVGTIFAVEVNENQEVAVRVLRGEVAVEVEQDQSPVAIEAGQAAAFPRDQQPSALDPQLASRDEALLEGRIQHQPAPEVTAQVDLEQLFEQAQRARRQGHHHQAATLYRRIIAADPRGASGGTALISLGQLSLGPLRQPARARQSFANYLASSRQSLRQEAFIGLYRAHRALGQADTAAGIAEQYRREYPTGRYRHVVD